MIKEEAFKLMVQDDGENCLVYVLQEIEHIVSSINYKDGKWYYELWNDYQDYSIYKLNISEELALSYFKVTPALDIKVIEDLGLLQACASDINIDIAEKTIIRIKQYLQKQDGIINTLFNPTDINLIRLLQRKYYKEGLQEIEFFSKDNRELKEINEEIKIIIGGNKDAKISI